MNAFIEKPGVRAIVSVALNMRRDLWDRRSKLDESDLTALGDTIYAYDDQ
jgi:hypothetical protein